MLLSHEIFESARPDPLLETEFCSVTIGLKHITHGLTLAETERYLHNLLRI